MTIDMLGLAGFGLMGLTFGRLGAGGGNRRSRPVNTVAPVVSGTTTVGQTLSTTNGSWLGLPTGYTYQWYQADTGGGTYLTGANGNPFTDFPIVGATSSTYVLQAGDVGQYIFCVVTATNGGGSASAFSNVTAAIAATGYVGPGDVVSGATSFWGLRGYNAAYATGGGAAIDIADGAGANQQAINILANGNLDVAAISAWIGLHGSTVRVIKLYDQVGSNHFISLAGAGSSAPTDPLLTLTGGGGGTQPRATFASSSFKTLVTTTKPLNGLSAFTLSGVATHTGAATVQQALVATNGLAPLMAYDNGTDELFIYMGGSIFSATASDGAIHSVQAVFNTTNSKLVVDGNVTGPTDVSAGTGSNEVLGLGSAGNGSRWLDGDFYEMYLKTSALTTGTIGGGSQTDLLRTNQKTYWGTP